MVIARRVRRRRTNAGSGHASEGRAPLWALFLAATVVTVWSHPSSCRADADPPILWPSVSLDFGAIHVEEIAIRAPDGTRTVRSGCTQRPHFRSLVPECAARAWFRGPGTYDVEVTGRLAHGPQLNTRSGRFQVRGDELAFALRTARGGVALTPRRRAEGVSLRWTRRSWPEPHAQQGEHWGFELVNASDRAFVIALLDGAPRGVVLRGAGGWDVVQRHDPGFCGTGVTTLRVAPHSGVPLGPWALESDAPVDFPVRRVVFLTPEADPRGSPLVVVSEPVRPPVRVFAPRTRTPLRVLPAPEEPSPKG